MIRRLLRYKNELNERILLLVKRKKDKNSCFLVLQMDNKNEKNVL